MTDTKLLHEIIEIVSNTKYYDGDYYEAFDEIHDRVKDTDYYKQLEERKKVYEQQRKIKELKNRQKRAEEEVQRRMIELQELEGDMKRVYKELGVETGHLK